MKSPLAIIANPMCSFAGVVLVSLADSSNLLTGKPADLRPLPPNPLLGDILALISALFYALYVSLLKVRIREENRINMQLFFGFVGLFNVVTLWPLGFMVHFLRIEPFEFPQNWKEWSGIGINVSLCSSIWSHHLFYYPDACDIFKRLYLRSCHAQDHSASRYYRTLLDNTHGCAWGLCSGKECNCARPHRCHPGVACLHCDRLRRCPATRVA